MSVLFADRPDEISDAIRESAIIPARSAARAYDEAKHPRGRGGRWTAKLSALKKGDEFHWQGVKYRHEGPNKYGNHAVNATKLHGGQTHVIPADTEVEPVNEPDAAFRERIQKARTTPRRAKLQARKAFADKPLHEMDEDELQRALDIAKKANESQQRTIRIRQVEAQIALRRTTKGGKKVGSKMSRRSGHDLLTEASVLFNPAAHPRGRGGKFREVLGHLHALKPGYSKRFGGRLVTRDDADPHVYVLQSGANVVHRGSVEEVAERLAPARPRAAKPSAPAPAADESGNIRVHGTQMRIQVHMERPGGKGEFQKGDSVVLPDGRTGMVMHPSHGRGGEQHYSVHVEKPKKGTKAYNEAEVFHEGKHVKRKTAVATVRKTAMERYKGMENQKAYADDAVAKYLDGWEHRDEGSGTETWPHSKLSYAPEQQQERLARGLEVAEKAAAVGKARTSPREFLPVQHPVTLSQNLVPPEWQVAHEYGSYDNPDRVNPGTGDRIKVMPNAPSPHAGKPGEVVKSAYSDRESGRTLVGVKIDGAPGVHSLGNNEIHSEYRQPYVRLKPGVNVEQMIFHYLAGRPAPPNPAPGTQAFAQWSYGMKGVKGATKPPGKKADRLALIRQITQALDAREREDWPEYERLVEVACTTRTLVGPVADEDLVLEEAVVIDSMRRFNYDPSKHPRGRGGMFREVLGGLKVNGFHRLGHGVSVEKGLIGVKVRTPHGDKGFLDAERAVSHAVEVHSDLQRKASGGPYYVASYTPGERGHGMQPVSPYRLPKGWRYHGDLFTKNEQGNAGPLRKGSEYVGSIHRDETGRIRVVKVENGRVTHEHPGEFAGTDFERAGESPLSASRSVSNWTFRQHPGAASPGEPKRAEQVAAIKKHMASPATKYRIAAERKARSRSGGRAQALVDAGLADDLADARAQIADMGEGGGRYSPGEPGGVGFRRNTRKIENMRGDSQRFGAVEVKREGGGSFSVHRRGEVIGSGLTAEQAAAEISSHFQGSQMAGARSPGERSLLFSDDDRVRQLQAEQERLRQEARAHRASGSQGVPGSTAEKRAGEAEARMTQIDQEIAALNAERRAQARVESPVTAGYVRWPGGDEISAGMRYRIPGGPHAGGVAETTGEETPGGLHKVRFPDGSVIGMRPESIMRAVRNNPVEQDSPVGGAYRSFLRDAPTSSVLSHYDTNLVNLAGEDASALPVRQAQISAIEDELRARGVDHEALRQMGTQRRRDEIARAYQGERGASSPGDRTGRSGAPVWTGDRLAGLRRIVERHQAYEIEGHLVDVQTANAMLLVHDALSPENKATFGSVSIPRFADFAWKSVR